jgi:3-hydroxyacyl-[acyl-carrier-protein] dehydratase
MRWMWIDQIVAFEPGRRMVAVKNVSLAEEHLHDHFGAEPAVGGRAALPARPVMPASLMIEGMAQTAGILVGSVNRFREKVVLAKVVSARFDADVFPGQSLRYDARLDRIDAAGAATTGTVERLDHRAEQAGWQPIGEVELLFSHLDHSLAGADLPDRNFVFAENFATLMQSEKLRVTSDE